MNKLENFTNRLVSTFTNIEKYFEIEERNTFLVCDVIPFRAFLVERINENGLVVIEKDRSEFVTTLWENQTLKINNSEEKAVFFPLDGKCGFIKSSDSNADAVIFNNNTVNFIEFKLNAESKGERAVRKNRKKAIRQLLASISLFDEKLEKNYCELEIKALVVTPLFYPRNDSEWKTFKVDFLENYGIELLELNEINI